MNEDAAKWIVGNGDGTQWRVRRNGSWNWTNNEGYATRYPSRAEAERAHEEDEDAWRVKKYSPLYSALSDGDDTMRFRLMQDGQSVAAVDGPAVAAMREISRYNAVYSQDGPCAIEWYTKGRRWKATDIDEIDSALAFRALATTPA